MLIEAGIEFEVRDISDNVIYQEEVKQFGFLGVPVTVVAGRAVKGLTSELVELVELVQNKNF